MCCCGFCGRPLAECAESDVCRREGYKPPMNMET